jgi:hypothetical protein
MPCEECDEAAAAQARKLVAVGALAGVALGVVAAVLFLGSQNA